MSESIQICTEARVRRAAFLARAADLYGRSPAVEAAELDGLDDTAALLLAFPWLSDAELLEALWALRHF
jgi:hypothetical protein